MAYFKWMSLFFSSPIKPALVLQRPFPPTQTPRGKVSGPPGASEWVPVLRADSGSCGAKGIRGRAGQRASPRGGSGRGPQTISTSWDDLSGPRGRFEAGNARLERPGGTEEGERPSL